MSTDDGPRELLPEEQKAQEWHQKQREPGAWHWVSSCWCCCEDCNPASNPVTPNPLWDEAITAQRRAATQPD